ncbi:MAG: penicillin acylase family protein [Desulfobacter sp.]|nr:penicillin acylase family protein [Desulfobacter sp.]
MSGFKKTMIGLFALIIIGVAAGAAFIHSIATRALPQYQGQIQLPGLENQVKVFRDKYGVPHIIAQNESDLYFAVGFTMAQDRLWQMDLLRRVTQGRLSEIFGKDLVDVDLLMRALRIPDKSRQILAKISPEMRLALDQFSKGMNHYMLTHQNRLPPEFAILGYAPEPWKPEYSVNLVGYMSWDLTLPNSTEMVLHKIKKKLGPKKFNALLPDILSQTPAIYDNFNLNQSELGLKQTLFDQQRILEDYGVAVFKGSNNWAAAGQKTITGKPLFANDMHLGLNAPGLWYQMHQMVKGKLNVTGVVLPGQPFVICGHNEDIAWGMTNVMVDDMDFYQERINPDNPDQYEFNKEFKNFTIKKEIIKIKGDKQVTQEIRFTHRGPVISKFKKIEDQTISMKWLGNEFSNELRTIYLLNRAKNWEDFKIAAKSFKAVSQNINYADVNGNIGLYCSAGVPIRKKGNGLFVYPGWTDEYDWDGLVPFEDLPHSYNPASGTVSSANNKTAPNTYPHYISHWFALNYRIDQIREMLSEKETLSIQDFKRMHGDFKSKLVEEFKPLILETLSNQDNLNTRQKTGLDLLKNWNGVMDKESPGAALFEVFYLHLVKNLIHDDLWDTLYQEYAASSILHRYLTRNIILSGGSSLSDNQLTLEKNKGRSKFCVS